MKMENKYSFCIMIGYMGIKIRRLWQKGGTYGEKQNQIYPI